MHVTREKRSPRYSGENRIKIPRKRIERLQKDVMVKEIEGMVVLAGLEIKEI